MQGTKSFIMPNLSVMVTIFLATTCNGYAQNTKQNLYAHKSGFIVFENHHNVFQMYFIEASYISLPLLLKNKDTINALRLGSPGDDASNVPSFKYYLNKSTRFDTMPCIAIIDNDGLYIEDTCIIEYKQGYINYVESKGFKVKKRFEKKLINNKSVILECQHYLPIESFTAIEPTKNRKRRKSTRIKKVSTSAFVSHESTK